MSRTHRAYAWQRLDLVGTTVVVVDEGPEEVVVHSVETCVDDGRAWATTATTVLDAHWRHLRTDLAVVDDSGKRERTLEDLGRCDVLDLAGNPFTNAFVLRRPGTGDDVEVLAAYVEPPSLEVRSVRQRYRRLGPDRWEYGDETGSFAMLVDAEGVVVDYEALVVRLSPPRISPLSA